MNLRNARVVLRLRPLPDQLDLALRVCVDNGPTFFKLTLLLLLPALAVCLVLRHVAGWSWWSIWPAAIALATVLEGPFTIATGQLMFQEAADPRALLKQFGRRLGTYLFTLGVTRLPAIVVLAMFAGGPLSGGSIALLTFVLVPLVTLVLVRRGFVHEVVLLENAGLRTAMKRAGQVMNRHGGAALGLVFWTFVAQATWVLGAEALGQAIVELVLQLGTPFGTLWSDGGSVFALAGLFASVPFVAVARFLLYIDIRTRKEGWDIQLKFAAIQAAEADAGRAAA